MHREAEYGVAAHWRYKEGRPIEKQKVQWMEELTKIQQGLKQNDFMNRLNELKLDMFQGRIFVFSPNGDVFDLPEESTPVDFAYVIHSEIGNSAGKAKINNDIAGLDVPLKSGDMCEILVEKNRKGPNPDWLKFVKTHHARTKIREALKRNKKKSILSFMKWQERA